jgi:hypothetical protein
MCYTSATYVNFMSMCKQMVQGNRKGKGSIGINVNILQLREKFTSYDHICDKKSQ